MDKRVLVIAPHADDEILGCGATIAKHIFNEDFVSIVIATNAHKGNKEIFSSKDIEIVRKEAIDAHSFLGVGKTYFLEFPAPALNAFPTHKISLELTNIINEILPDILYLPHPGDLHEDHNSIYRAALVSARPIYKHRISEIFCYETLSETVWAPMQGNNIFSPNHYIDVTDFFEKKIAAFRFYKSQIKEFPHSRSIKALYALSQLRGSTIGVDYAECFEVERQIR